MLRGRIWILAVLLALMPLPALAHDGNKMTDPDTSKTMPVTNDDKKTEDRHDQGGEEKHQEQTGGEKKKQEHQGGMEYDSSYSFYGSVRWSEGHVVAGSRKLVGSNPWLDYLAPGMRLEVRGKVEDGAIDVSQVVVLYPRSWSFYEGPAKLVGLPGDWIKAWFDGGDGPFRSMAADPQPDGPINLVACYRSDGWRALPPGLDPKITPPRDGWWLLEGVVRKGEVYWRLADDLPGNCGG